MLKSAVKNYVKSDNYDNADDPAIRKKANASPSSKG